MHRGRVKLIFDSIFDVGLGDTIKRATLNVSIGRPVLLRPEDGTTKAKGRSPLPAQGYVPRVWPKSSICPTSPRLRRAVSLSPARMAEEFDLPYFAKATKGCFFKSRAYGRRVRSVGGGRSGSLLVYRFRQAMGIGRREFCYRCLRA